PYAAVAIAVVVAIYRFWFDPFSVSSQSSQFLENRKLFFGSVPWHYGVIIILLGHMTALLFPGVWGLFTANQTRLYVLEITGLALALMTTVGILILIYRRFTDARAQSVTSPYDWILLFFLF